MNLNIEAAVHSFGIREQVMRHSRSEMQSHGSAEGEGVGGSSYFQMKLMAGHLSSRTQSKMRLTMSGGFFRAFREAMSFGVMLFKAARADSKAGFAASKSFSALSFTPAISCIFGHIMCAFLL